MKNERNITGSEIKSSAKRIGQLYPILVDYHGNIVDGVHRFKANENWRKVKLEHIKTEQDRLIARIVSNNARRNVPKEEKINTLNRLGEIFLDHGLEPGRIAYEIAKETGMSYRWVSKYLPNKFKDDLQSDRKRYKCVRARKSVASCASVAENFVDPPEGFLDIVAYKNTDFVSFTMKKCHFDKLKKKADRLGTTPIKLIYNGIQLILRTKAKHVSPIKKINTSIVNLHEELRVHAK